LQIYNTLTHKKEQFKSIKEGAAGMYSCGPTVYNFAHIGNMRSYIFADLLKRTLMHNGYTVKHVINITDVGHLVSDANLGEDKMRVTAQHEHKSLNEIAKFYTKEFMEDIKKLKLIMPDIMPKASEHVDVMLKLIDTLDSKGYLYSIKTGVYFDTSKFKDYGALMGLSFKELNDYLISGARIERASGTKNTTDFAVWRLSKPEETEMVWDTKYGKGFPGWHIECSAMSMMYLGEHFDLHTGGIDHLPIHHTNEIAQSEAATGKKFVNYWLHHEHLQVNGKKMSKSLGNVYRLQDIIEKGYSANAFKYLIESAHYRTQLNFTFDGMDGAEKTIDGIYSIIERLAEVSRTGRQGPKDSKLIEDASKIKDEFFKYMNDDLNTPLALSKLHNLIGEANKAYDKGMSREGAAAVLQALLEIDTVLGLEFDKHTQKEALPEGAKQLIEEREGFRLAKNFKEADLIRKKLHDEYGITVEDGERGPVWHKA